MNNIFCILILLVARVGVSQQLVLTGAVTPVKPVELNDTYDGNYWKYTASFITPDASGKFRKPLPAQRPGGCGWATMRTANGYYSAPDGLCR
jgi:hypothetical protein